MAEKKVLLVDDDEEFVEVTKILLENNDYTVATAHSGKEVQKTTLEEEPDLVILDVMMETESAGFEAARLLRSEEATKDIPIIMLTAVNEKYPYGFESNEIWLPVDKFFEKPVEPDELLLEVKNSLSE
ncbi:MAG: response regulator [Planctomycetes bacterium]|nr:response regulator [Planctomycetota bacterium]